MDFLVSLKCLNLMFKIKIRKECNKVSSRESLYQLPGECRVGIYN